MPHRGVPRPLPDEVFDIGVVGGGHAGFAAALRLARSGRRVVLIDRGGDLVAESGRSFAGIAGTGDEPIWRELVAGVDRLGGLGPDWLDGALTECVATSMLMASPIRALYHATVIGMDLDSDGLPNAVRVATRAGVRRIRAGRWLDATPTGEFIGILNPGESRRDPSGSRGWMFLQHPDWAALPIPDDARVTAWPSERALPLGFSAGHGPDLLGGLDQVAGILGPAELRRVCLSHFSFAPFHLYDPAAQPHRELPANVVSAVAPLGSEAITDLSTLHQLGISAADLAQRVPAAGPGKPGLDPVWAPVTSARTEVTVVGAGTGGVLATVAAARSGVRVHAVEGSTQVGGVGTVGGIHVYWFGAPGGLQTELDDRTRSIMHSHARGPFRDGPFNPWAKLIAAEQMLAESGATLSRETVLYEVERRGEAITAIWCARPGGIMKIEAEAFVDATGDGDLCALAGADFRLGRETDGLLHAYSQSSGRLRRLHGEPRMDTVNFDAGFCDPTDPVDLTRARQEGIAAYLIAGAFEETQRPTYVAPALGIRQGRQIATDLVLTLDDLVSRRRFPDAIGYTASHFDNHATDMQFESDQAVFYQWVLGQARVPIGAELSYRQLLPVGLANVWIGSRCLGLTQEAQYVTRMQRDIQRVGEVAGLAAALAVRERTGSRTVDLARLQELLTASTALGTRPRSLETTFGLYQRLSDDGEVQFQPRQATSHALLDQLRPGNAVPTSVGQVVAALDSAMPDASLWWAAHNPEACRDQVEARLASSNPSTTWLAACVLAMWNQTAAEPRLLAAIETLEPSPIRHRPRLQEGSEAGPSEAERSAPRWLTAVVLLGRCGTEAAIPVLASLAAIRTHSVDTLSTVALAVGRLATRLDGSRDRASLRQILDTLKAATPLATTDYAARDVGAHSHTAATRGHPAPDHVAANHVTEPIASQLRATYQDRTPQLAKALAAAERLLGDIGELTAPEV